ncbi:unnamed protein product [Citrullus colocynthis]|uniref:Uncharacterized protein n=1 Tax=Citrullus colocynthis TaxID=252529 RepID=A0ABP0YAY9_9ROSI
MTSGTDMQVKEFVCSCCKDPLAILSSNKKRWAERKQKQILYEFQALSLAMENRCFGITKPFLVTFMIFKSLFGPSCQGRQAIMLMMILLSGENMHGMKYVSI